MYVCDCFINKQYTVHLLVIVCATHFNDIIQLSECPVHTIFNFFRHNRTNRGEIIGRLFRARARIVFVISDHDHDLRTQANTCVRAYNNNKYTQILTLSLPLSFAFPVDGWLLSGTYVSAFLHISSARSPCSWQNHS